ncbi:MAG: hypothetical protein ACKERF_00760 [Candidatus Hodgkinia cicadicola]
MSYSIIEFTNLSLIQRALVDKFRWNCWSSNRIAYYPAIQNITSHVDYIDYTHEFMVNCNRYLNWWHTNIQFYCKVLKQRCN